jgi:hypothetical protein
MLPASLMDGMKNVTVKFSLSGIEARPVADKSIAHAS